MSIFAINPAVDFRELVVSTVSGSTLRDAIHNDTVSKRNTMLKERLNKE